MATGSGILKSAAPVLHNWSWNCGNCEVGRLEMIYDRFAEANATGFGSSAAS